MDFWYEEGKRVGFPLTETSQQYPLFTNGYSLGTTTNFDSAAASPTGSGMPWISSIPPPAFNQHHTPTFQSVQAPYRSGYQHFEGPVFAPHPQRQWPSPYVDVESRFGRHQILPGSSYGHSSPNNLEPWSGSTYRHTTTESTQTTLANVPASAPQEATDVPHGPPRKPKRSGYALWVGNLPVGLSIVRAKDFFSRGATQEIESVFLISRSKCAFINYRTQESCRAAQLRFHGSQLDGKNIICRLRRDPPCSGDGFASPLVQAHNNSHGSRVTGTTAFVKRETMPVIVGTPPASSTATPSRTSSGTNSRVPEKFIILKSLSVVDLEASVRRGLWTTQAHNEIVLEKALDESDKVYLVFSVNKSGEYFGYARLLSPVPIDHKQIPLGPALEAFDTAHPIRPISTFATSTAPEGRIVDDSNRGTLFWEAVHSDDDENNDKMVYPKSESGTNGDRGGRAFAIEWLSTKRVPFYRTRGLQNPWNENKEIKIARDGTEVEPSVGRRLLSLFTSV